MDEKIKKAFDFAQDSVKQLIALATGIITLSITFGKDFIGGSVNAVARPIALVSWGAFLISVFCGLWALLALTGTLEPAGKARAVKVSIRGKNVTTPSMLQILLSIVGLALTVVYGIVAAIDK